MDNQNKLDINPEIGYNVDNDENVEVIDLAEVPPLNDTECKHVTLIPNPEDRLENGAIYHGCANVRCGRGFYLLPSPK